MSSTEYYRLTPTISKKNYKMLSATPAFSDISSDKVTTKRFSIQSLYKNKEQTIPPVEYYQKPAPSNSKTSFRVRNSMHTTSKSEKKTMNRIATDLLRLNSLPTSKSLDSITSSPLPKTEVHYIRYLFILGIVILLSVQIISNILN